MQKLSKQSDIYLDAVLKALRKMVDNNIFSKLSENETYFTALTYFVHFWLRR